MDRARAAACVVSLALIGATLEPLLREPVDDGFPLSTYPMFATKRNTRQSFHYALGYSQDGVRHTLSPHVIGSGEVLQALDVVDRAVAHGPDATMKLCQTIAARVATQSEFANIVSVRIVRGTHDALDYLTHGTVGTETAYVTCKVSR